MARRIRAQELARLTIVVATMILLLAGCSFPGQLSQPDMAKDQTLKMVVPFGANGENSLPPDPVRAYDALSQQVANLLFDGLVTLDRNGHVEPWGATSWTISPDGLTYTFTLRPNQRFSDGTPVKPSDYAWSMDRAANPCVDGVADFSYLTALKDARAFHLETCSDEAPTGAIKTLIGDSIAPNDSAGTLSLVLAQPAGYFLAALTMPVSDVLERSAVTGADLGKEGAWVKNLMQGTTGQGGSGMFYVAKWQSTDNENETPGSLTLKPNPHWWGLHAGKTPHFSEIDLIESDVHTTDTGTFRSDPSIAWVGISLSDPDISVLRNQPYYHAVSALISSGLIFNWKIAPFDDLNARKAFCLAINRDQINQQVFQGQVIPSWHIVPQGMDGYNPNLRGLDGAGVTGDATLARQYWQRYLAAHHNSAPRIVIPATSSNIGQAAISLYQKSWNQALGVQVATYEIRTIIDEQSLHYIQLSRFTSGAAYADPQEFLSQFFESNAIYNYQNSIVPDADALMKRADALSDMRQRIPLYNQAEQLLIDNAAICPLSQPVNHYALRSWVKGDFVEDGRGLFPNDAWVSGYIAKH